MTVADNGDLYFFGGNRLYRIPRSALPGTYNPPNTIPTGVADQFATGLDTALDLISGPEGVLGNDSDIDNDDLHTELVDEPKHGSMTWYPNGGFTYTPKAGFQGIDTFTYRVSDGRDWSQPVQAQIQVGAVSVNQREVAVDVLPGHLWSVNEPDDVQMESEPKDGQQKAVYSSSKTVHLQPVSTADG